MRKLLSYFLVAAFLALPVYHTALADEWHGRGDIHGFHERDYDHWRGGSWYNGFHDGRNGWWWIVDGAWYFYPSPIYPYPDPYTPSTVEVVPSPGTAVVTQPSYVYYCRNPQGYYPYVPQCYEPWHKVLSSTVSAPGTIVVQQPAVQPAPAGQQLVPQGGEREVDMQQLGVFTAAFQNIDLTGKQANARLKDLDKQIGAFRQSLYERNYNAMDVLKEAENLQHRISEQRAKLMHKAEHSSGSSVNPTSQPAPTAVPPGTTVTFPPQ